MKILQYITPYTPTPNATGTIAASASITENAKLSDANINYLPGRELIYKARHKLLHACIFIPAHIDLLLFIFQLHICMS